VALQTLENKALSWGSIGKSAPILAEITIRKSQCHKLLILAYLGNLSVQVIYFRKDKFPPFRCFEDEGVLTSEVKQLGQSGRYGGQFNDFQADTPCRV
jgi:hypothetical protein